MMRNRRIVSPGSTGLVLILILFWGCAAVKPAPPDRPEWHTPPDRWQEPRIYQISEEDDRSRITIDHQQRSGEGFTTKVFSPNKVYWFGVKADWPDPPLEECGGVEFLVTESEAEIFIFTEREYLLRINIPDHYRNFTIRTVWVNERLLYLRVWRGRIRASDVIIDVENERIVHSETTCWGLTVFQQWNIEAH